MLTVMSHRLNLNAPFCHFIYPLSLSTLVMYDKVCERALLSLQSLRRVSRAVAKCGRERVHELAPNEDIRVEC